MALAHGSDISAEEVERIISREFTPSRFASLCNSLIFALTEFAPLGLPSFTERTNVKDGGIDAEWDADFPDNSVKLSSLIRKGWNIYQFKQRDIFASDRETTFKGIKASVTGAITDIYIRTNKRPDHYVLFTNLDLTHFTKAQKGATPQKKELQAAILKSYDQPDKVEVSIVSAAELTAFINSVPHLRSAYFAASKFISWQAFHDQQNILKTNVFGPSIELIGREGVLTEIKAAIDNPSVRAIALYGQHNIGKTRLVVEATRHRYHDIIVSVDPSNINGEDILKLNSPQKECLLVIDDPNEKDVLSFVNTVLKIDKVKLVFTIPQTETAAVPNFGLDTRVRSFFIKPLPSDHAQQLLQKANPLIDHSLGSWILDQAGGNPGIILVAATLGHDLRKKHQSFREAIGAAFAQRINESLGKEYLDVLSLCSIMSSIGIGGNAQQEIRLVCGLIGGGIDVNIIINSIPVLEKSGLLKHRGKYVQVHPRILADYLAARIFSGRISEITAIILGLTPPGLERMFERMHSVDNNDVENLWNSLLGEKGLFNSLNQVTQLGNLLRLIAARKPDKVSSLIFRLISNTSPEELKSIDSDRRRDLIWSIEELLFRDPSAESALQALKFLALAETETHIGNNSTGVFCECFLYWHSQFPLSLTKRMSILKELVDPANSDETIQLGLKAIIRAQADRTISLRPSIGSTPLSSRPIITYQEMWEYNEGLIDLLIEIAQLGRGKISKEAAQAIPMSLRPRDDEKRLTELVQRAQQIMALWQSQKISFDVSDLAISLQILKEELEKQILAIGTGAEKAKINIALTIVRDLIETIENGSFELRAKRWIGGWSLSSRELKLDDGSTLFGDEIDIRELALEVAAHPEVLTDELLQWLSTDAAKQGNIFLYWLGRLDSTNTCLPTLERIATNPSGINLLLTYFYGWAQRSKEEARSFLEQDEIDIRYGSEFTLRGIHAIGGTKRGVERINGLLQKHALDPQIAERVLMTGSWAATLEPDDFLSLLKNIGGEHLENASSVIDFYNMWLHLKGATTPDLIEYIWSCLEHLPSTGMNESYKIDNVATSLISSNVERAFSLLESVLSQTDQNHPWNPFEYRNSTKFFEELKKLDCKRTWFIILESLLKKNRRYDVEYSLRSTINWKTDGLYLLQFIGTDKKKALIILDLINSNKSGFWDFAEQIINIFPSDQEIGTRLLRAVDPSRSEGYSGFYSELLEKKRTEAEMRIDSARGPYKEWLITVNSTYGEIIQQALSGEIDEDINGFRSYYQNEYGDLKVWAVASLIKSKQFDLLKKVMSKAELERVLPSLDLSADELQELYSIWK